MKTSLKALLAVSLLSAAFVGSASAQTIDVYITGSSAYRGAVTNAIGHLLTSPVAAYVGSSLAGANQQLIVGVPNATGTASPNGLTSGTTYYFHTCWTGSVAGITAVVYGIHPAIPSGATGAFLPDTVTTSAMTVGTGASSSNGSSGGNSVSVGLATSDHIADGAFSDVYQSSTIYKSPTLTQANGHVVGVVPFVFVAGADATAFVGVSGGKITNIGPVQAQQLYPNSIPASQFTGADSDSANYIVPVGRNADSGTRLTTFAETGFNPVGGAIKQPQQYAISTSGSSVFVDLYPAETLFSGTVAAQSYTSGQSGYSSGSGESTALQIAGTNGGNSDNPELTIGSLGEGDASSAVKNNCSYMSYNGVSYGSISGTTTSYNRSLIDEGVYTLWGYEHLYYNGTANGNSVPLDRIAKEIRAVDAPIAGETIANMAVERSFEGGPISYVGIGASTK